MPQGPSVKILGTALLLIVAVAIMFIIVLYIGDGDVKDSWFTTLLFSSIFLIGPLVGWRFTSMFNQASFLHMSSMINKQYENSKNMYCPICHANMGNSKKCPECGHIIE